MRKRTSWPSGRVVTLEHTSRVLEGNPLNDPHVRTLDVWLPPQYDQPRSRGRRFPVVYDLVGFTGSGRAHTAWRAFDENVPERAARLVHERRMGPMIIVFPDCFTSLGGNQYINSGAIGRYADYLTRELIPFVDREFRTLASREHRGCFGKSSGGYGSMIHAMQYPRYWGAIANHSGDAYFDYVYAADWPNTLDELAKFRRPKQVPGRRDVAKAARAAGYSGRDDGRIARFLEHVWRKEKLGSGEAHALMNLAMAASYDPDPRAPNGFRVPYNLETGELLPERWQRWLAHDPVNLVARYARNLRTLRGIFIDCGWRDQYRIHYGSRLLSKRLTEHRVPHVYEEFDDTHSGIDYRMDRSLPFLSKALR
ncbi:MAG TPA: alpha/beta hydrolase-fold protein [Gammaproteobacteria bacterium]|nr:alpha/beta hydrolase-fold protein [Gammaproteobacteria bacterium]